MRFVVDLFLALVLVALFFFGLGFALPSTAHVERSILIERDPPWHLLDEMARMPLCIAGASARPLALHVHRHCTPPLKHRSEWGRIGRVRSVLRRSCVVFGFGCECVWRQAADSERARSISQSGR